MRTVALRRITTVVVTGWALRPCRRVGDAAIGATSDIARTRGRLLELTVTRLTGTEEAMATVTANASALPVEELIDLGAGPAEPRATR
ncbi:hypothetical protein ACFQE5_15840 [Pseudonocardia hispaniensis]|uniref:Uncharacterized protein n=1 Tax=Pseudonocardia hispaniensis TaxID=904933 RepID=A0ABW1J4D8_9PSEU